MFLPIVFRIAACMTALLSIGVVAVSTYAAKTAPPHAVVREAEAAELASASTEFGDVTDPVLPGPSELVAPVKVEQPVATAEPRYAVPDDVAGVAPSGGTRGNLSPGARTWQVVSIPPGAFDPAQLARGSIDIPSDQLGVMLQVSLETDIPWQVFGAIATIESDLGRNMATSSAGAIGYGQFLPSTWDIYGEGGDPYDFRDVIPAMGRFLLEAGAPDDIPTALYAYNHSWSYVAQVMGVASALGYPERDGVREGLIWPVVGPISSYYGPSHPLGIDIDQTMAIGAAVLAAHSGEVLFAGGDPCCSYGNYVILASPTGITTLYGHLDSFAVETGDTVRQGEPLGIVGNTGFSTGTHLHFEVLDGGFRQNPLDYLP